MKNQGVFTGIFKQVITTIEQKIIVCDSPDEKNRLKKRLRHLKRKYAPEQQNQTVVATGRNRSVESVH